MRRRPWLWRVPLVLFAVVALAIRFAPTDAGAWALDPGAPDFTPPEAAAVFCPEPGTRHFAEATEADLVRLGAIAEAWRGTRRIAGEEGGPVTWQTRSRIVGFPDYTSAALRNWGEVTGLCIVARQRYGAFDWGVNARRVGDWVAGLWGLEERPPMVAPAAWTGGPG
ncbi:DUF1499 domain-containing protein [Wenxinia marina]|uniref:DUF1499 domain-containing protein n=1 Tax=Wenxinia marina DSM 24838 TaxID=1123501 RepID=A0A0D0QA48_9RHOB|nr:DUF1499 domain-containing protein [Wenxinia marina]KIQ67878.1 hypothetical protein Wenmar_03608 [Wenxinia marina DSM 24838]GGL74378.1 hypothetical protein GCM10011392_31190 [Wenxinia marina]